MIFSPSVIDFLTPPAATADRTGRNDFNPLADGCISMNILVIMYSVVVPSGVVGECIIDRGGCYSTVMPHDGDALPPDSGKFDGMIILGGPMSAADDEKFPTHPPLLRLIRDFDDAGKPVLGICLGAQLIARAYGKRVFTLPDMELGFKPVRLTGAGRLDPLLWDAGEEPVHMMQWHSDSFDLPEGATLLMAGEDCRNQAYRVGDCVYGFQFHLEVTPDIIRAWARDPEFVVGERFAPVLRDLDRQIAFHMKRSFSLARRVTNRWLDMAGMRRGMRLLLGK